MAGKVLIKMGGVGKLGPQLQVRAKNFSERQTKALQGAAREAKAQIEELGRANIAAGGNFGSARWQDGFQAKVSFQSRTDLNIRVTHAVSYWKVFEFGAVIHGKPLLWIPMKNSEAAVLGVRARDFGQPLFRVNRKGGGAPLLMSKGGKVQYFGKEQVRIPKKWNLRQIVRTVARQMNVFYKEAMKNGG
jgi:hypothetical protein